MHVAHGTEAQVGKAIRAQFGAVRYHLCAGFDCRGGDAAIVVGHHGAAEDVFRRRQDLGDKGVIVQVADARRNPLTSTQSRSRVFVFPNPE